MEMNSRQTNENLQHRLSVIFEHVEGSEQTGGLTFQSKTDPILSYVFKELASSPKGFFTIRTGERRIETRDGFIATYKELVKHDIE